MNRKTVQKILVEVDGKNVPAKVYREWRNSVRFSIGKSVAILRMPLLLSKKQQEVQVAAFKNWVQQQFKKKEAVNQRFFGRGYQDGSILKVGKRIYELRLEFSENKSHSARLSSGFIFLKLSRTDSEVHLQKAIRHLLSRLVAQDFLPEITARVLEINRLHFQQPVRSVNLKYNISNWGSCSAKSNLNLSTRLLFAPDKVIDYVIVHELAHLIELNHSPKFWSLVARVMPDYRRKEQWLEKNGHLCDF